jgi:hypothetical protein
MNPLLAAWLFLSVVAVIWVAQELSESMDDADTIRALNGRLEEVTVEGLVAQEAIRLIKQIVYLVIGLAALDPGASWLIGPLFIASQVLLLANTWLARVARKRLQRIARQSE